MEKQIRAMGHLVLSEIGHDQLLSIEFVRALHAGAITGWLSAVLLPMMRTRSACSMSAIEPSRRRTTVRNSPIVAGAWQ
jgi:hypothetical protein